MSIYDDIARGFNPLQGLEDAAGIKLEGARLKHEMDQEKEKGQIAAEDRQNKLNQQAFENSMEVQELISSMNDEQRKRFQQSIEDMARIGDFVESQPDPEGAYQRALPYLKQKYPDSDFPKQYDRESMAMLRSLVTPINQLVAGDTYGAPIEAQDAAGNPAFIQANKQGEVKPVEGYVPLSQKLGMGDLTITQEAKNLTIEQARRALKSRNLDQAKIKAATQQYTDTGRSNPDYDPQLSGLLKAALTRKVGEDPEFEELYGQFYGKSAPQEEPVGGAQQGGEQTPIPGARKAPDGNWYIEDPNNPGKYLRVEQ